MRVAAEVLLGPTKDHLSRFDVTYSHLFLANIDHGDDVDVGDGGVEVVVADRGDDGGGDVGLWWCEAAPEWMEEDEGGSIDMNNLESDDESVDTPLVSPFPHSYNDLDDGEVLNDLIEYENVGMLRRERAINSFDGDDLAFQCMIGFKKFVAYFDPFLPMNIITHKAYNTIMVEGYQSTGKNLVAVVRDVYVFVGSFTYITDFVVLEDIGEFILINKAKFAMGKPFRKITKLEYSCAKGLISFNGIFDNYTFQMPRTILRFKRWGSLEALRKFHWTTLGGRSNQLSHVSSPLLSKLGEY
ncbi:hypothetical protein Tco_0164207 [Tanacetum coccineum]